MNRFTALAITICAAAFLSSCTKTDSENIKTKGLYAEYSVEGNNQSTATCTARFSVGGGGGTAIELSGEDKVTCNGAQMTKVSNWDNSVIYKADVPYSPGSQYKIVLRRPSEDPYVSFVELPPRISGMNPGSAFAVPKGTVLNPTWDASPSGLDEMTVELSYKYNDGIAERNAPGASQRDPSPERGVVGFGAGDTSQRPQPAGTWSGALTYKRSRHGEVAPGLNGLVTASQKAVVPMQLTD